MSRNGSGTYTAPSNSFNPAVEGTEIDEGDWNTTLQDIVDALTESTFTAGMGSTDNVLVRTDGTSGKKVQGTSVVVDDSDNVSGMATLTLPNTGLHLLDTNASHDLIVAPGSDLSADRTLTITTGDADRVLTITADSSVGGTAYVVSGTDVALADGGTGASLTDPNADRLMFWDDSEGTMAWLTPGTGLTITGTQIDVSAGAGDVTAASNFAVDNVILRSDGTTKGAQASGISIDDTDNVTGVASIATTTIELGHASDTTIARSGAGDITIEGNAVYRAGGTDVSLADGGTGASLSDPGADRLMAWDDTAGSVKFMPLADFNVEAAPATGDYLMAYTAEGALVAVNWSSLPGAGGGISNVVEDTTPQLGGMLDVNGNALGDGTLELLKFSETASAVNEVTIANAATGGAPSLSATGDDTNIDLQLAGKGTGGLVAAFKNATGLGIKDSDSSHSLLVTTSSNLTANRTLTFVPGDASRTLTIPGDVTLTAPTKQIFTASGTWTKPTGCRFIKVTGVGAGGGGGGCASASSNAAVGRSGGAGGLFIKWIDVTAISSETVTIGAGGAGGAAGENAGSSGGTTSFGAHASATGGAGGAGGATGSTVFFWPGAVGGVGSSGDVNGEGAAGGVSYRINGAAVISGVGGTSFFGGGGASSDAAGAGNAGVTPGSGGNGGLSESGSGTQPGGDGADGLAIVEEFY